MSNFLTASSIAKADAIRCAANGATAFDEIRKALAQPARASMEDLLQKGMKPSRISDPNADDAVDKEDEDADDDMCLTTEERKSKKKARADRDRRQSGADGAMKAMKAINACVPQQETPDFFAKLASPKNREEIGDSRPSVQRIKHAQQHPMTMEKLLSQGNNNHPIDMEQVQRIVVRGKRQMRKAKPSFPPNSTNGQWGGAIADNGAGNNWHDENTQRPAVGHMGGHATINVGPSDPCIRAAVDASGTSNRDLAVNAIKSDWARRKMQMASTFANRPAVRSNDRGNP